MGTVGTAAVQTLVGLSCARNVGVGLGQPSLGWCAFPPQQKMAQQQLIVGIGGCGAGDDVRAGAHVLERPPSSGCCKRPLRCGLHAVTICVSVCVGHKRMALCIMCRVAQ